MFEETSVSVLTIFISASVCKRIYYEYAEVCLLLVTAVTRPPG